MPVQLGSAYGSIRLDASGVAQGVALARSALLQIRGEFGLMAGEVDRQTKTAAASFGAFKQKLDSIAGDLAGFGTKLALGISAPLLKAGTDALNMGGDFQEVMLQVAALTNIPRDQIAGLSQDILKMSKDTGRAPKELAEAFYFIVSSGYAGQEALDVLNASAKASAAGLGETKVIADAVTSAVSAYGKENLSAAQATDILLGAVKEGKGEPDALAGAIGRVLPVAAQMGVGFDEVAASIATMTRTGMNADEASTSLRGTLSAFMAPGKDAKETLQVLGLTTEALKKNIKDNGLLAALEDLTKRAENVAGKTITTVTAHQQSASAVKAHENKVIDLNATLARLHKEQEQTARDLEITAAGAGHGKISVGDLKTKQENLAAQIDKTNRELELENLRHQEASNAAKVHTQKMGDVGEILDHIIPNVRALTGVMSTSVSQGKAYDEVLKNIKGSAGATDQAFRVASEGLNFQWNRALAIAKAETIKMSLGIVEAMTPIIQMIGDQLPSAIQRMQAWWASLSPQLQIAIEVFAGVLAVAGPIALALGGILTVVGALISPIGLVVVAIAALAAAWIANVGGIQEKTFGFFGWIAPYVSQAMNAVSSVVQNVLGQIQLWWTTHGANVMTIVNAGMMFLQGVIVAALGVIMGLWNTWGSTILTIWNLLWANVQAAVNFALTYVSLLIDTFAAALNGNWFAVGYNLGLIWQTAWEFIKTILQNAWNAIVAIVNDWGPSVGAAVQNVIAGIINTFKNTNWKKLGTDLMEGVKQGIQDKIESILAMMRGLISSMIGAARSEAKAESPSRKMMELGDDMGEGLGIGWLKRQAWLMDAGQRVVGAMMPSAPALAMAGAGAGGGGNVTNNRNMGGDTFNIAVSGERSRALANALIEERINARLNALMGG